MSMLELILIWISLGIRCGAFEVEVVLTLADTSRGCV